MKARGHLAILACSLAATLALPALAAGATGKAAEMRLSSFSLEGSNGYEVEVGSFREGGVNRVVVVSAENGPFEVNYEVRPGPGPGIQAAFGSLGQIDVRFERRRKKIIRTKAGCRTVFEAGVFRASFRFTGEGGYFSTEAADPEGEVMRLPDGFCGFEDDRRPRLAIPGLSRTTLEARKVDGGGVVSFQASRFSLDRFATFTAALRERIGAMRVERIARATGRIGDSFSSRASRASVSPPPPFRGSARFRDPARGPASWTGSLSVSLPGVEEVALTGEAFLAKLCPRQAILARCLRDGRTAPSGRPAPYGSGSHSQPLALARLSSLR